MLNNCPYCGVILKIINGKTFCPNCGLIEDNDKEGENRDKIPFYV